MESNAIIFMICKFAHATHAPTDTSITVSQCVPRKVLRYMLALFADFFLSPALTEDGV